MFGVIHFGYYVLISVEIPPIHITHRNTHGWRHEFLLFLCNQLSEKDAWWDRALADVKSLLMLCGEVK